MGSIRTSKATDNRLTSDNSPPRSAGKYDRGPIPINSGVECTRVPSILRSGGSSDGVECTRVPSILRSGGSSDGVECTRVPSILRAGGSSDGVESHRNL